MVSHKKQRNPQGMLCFCVKINAYRRSYTHHLWRCLMFCFVRITFFRYNKNCGHVTAQKCNLLGTITPLRACHCSEIHCSGTKQAPAGSEMHFLGTHTNMRACYCSEIYFLGTTKNNSCGHVTAHKCYLGGT